jgi:hypothetical protein
MIKRCGALVLGLLVLSASSAFARHDDCWENARYGQRPVVQAQAGFYNAYNGGGYVQPSGYTMGYPTNGVYNAAGANNVAVYQNQMNQTAQVYGYNNAYNQGYAGVGNNYGGGFTTYGNGAYVGVNPWNGYTSNSYNGYTYNQPGYVQYNNAAQYRQPCQNRNAFGGNQRYWISR